MSFNVFFKRIFEPHRLKIIGKYNRQNHLNILDVGCGNNSCKLTKNWLPVQSYHGVDKEFWHGNEADYKTMDHVFFIDIENEPEKFSEIQNEYYEVIILSHIIEHVKNGYEVIESLLPKLKKGGLIYIEAPHPRTLGFPPAIGFFNFHDEPTHKMIYDHYNVARTLLKHDFTILRAKTRRDLFRVIFFSPVAILLNIFYYLPVRQKLYVTGLWDLFGVAFYVIGKK
jgi:2-polyprenyl-3-methyl-5-hydroxy-6-metoxy-1,4-benzoquinol methylase